MLHPGNPRPEYELCLDCKLQAADGILHHCHSGKHVPITVVYVDEESREIVPVPLPRNVGKMSKASKFRVTHLPSECRNPQFCSFPHHHLAAKIMNQWRGRTVKVSKPPTLVCSKWSIVLSDITLVTSIRNVPNKNGYTPICISTLRRNWPNSGSKEYLRVIASFNVLKTTVWPKPVWSTRKSKASQAALVFYFPLNFCAFLAHATRHFPI